MCQNRKIAIKGFTAEQQKDGTFLYKAENTTPTLPISKSKKVYKDKPQFKVIEEVETKFKASGHQMLTQLGKDVILKLKSF